jgi:hypothetical protein
MIVNNSIALSGNIARVAVHIDFEELSEMHAFIDLNMERSEW